MSRLLLLGLFRLWVVVGCMPGTARGADSWQSCAFQVASDLRVAVPITLPAEIEAASVRKDPKFLWLLWVLYGVESRWNAGAISEAGARGIGQLMPATAAEVAMQRDENINVPEDLFKLDVNVRLSSHLLDNLLGRVNGNVPAALVAYNAGPAWIKHLELLQKIPAETSEYVTRIMYLLHECQV